MMDFAQSWRRFVELDPLPQPPLIKARYPVVLMHGFGLLASLRRGGHLHQEAMSLREHGVIAYAPNVAPYNGVMARARMWQSRLEMILEETGAQKLNLIAQSMGGLDARYLISRAGFHNVVASLVTVSTPHHGSSIANIVLEQPVRMQQWVADVLNWMGTASMGEVAADFLGSVPELTPEYVLNEFNAAVPDHPSVRYFSYAGQAGKGTGVAINPLLLVLNLPLYAREGPNDGFVSVESARWGEFLGTIGADHAAQVGIKFLGNRAFDSHEFYRMVVARLADEGF